MVKQIQPKATRSLGHSLQCDQGQKVFGHQTSRQVRQTAQRPQFLHTSSVLDHPVRFIHPLLRKGSGWRRSQQWEASSSRNSAWAPFPGRKFKRFELGYNNPQMLRTWPRRSRQSKETMPEMDPTNKTNDQKQNNQKAGNWMKLATWVSLRDLESHLISAQAQEQSCCPQTWLESALLARRPDSANRPKFQWSNGPMWPANGATSTCLRSLHSLIRVSSICFCISFCRPSAGQPNLQDRLWRPLQADQVKVSGLHDLKLGSSIAPLPIACIVDWSFPKRPGNKIVPKQCSCSRPADLTQANNVNIQVTSTCFSKIKMPHTKENVHLLPVC